MFYLAAAFIAVWVAVLVYVVYLSNRQSRLEDELHTIEELLQAQQARRS